MIIVELLVKINDYVYVRPSEVRCVLQPKDSSYIHLKDTDKVIEVFDQTPEEIVEKLSQSHVKVKVEESE